jgi:hypothetical protein
MEDGNETKYKKGLKMEFKSVEIFIQVEKTLPSFLLNLVFSE